MTSRVRHGECHPRSRCAVRRYFDLEKAAKEPTFFVYPAGLPDEGGRFTWSDPADPASALRD